MVIAVLETHAGVRLGQHDVYLNVAGGLKIIEPAADLAAAAALVSSHHRQDPADRLGVLRRDRPFGRDPAGGSRAARG